MADLISQALIAELRTLIEGSRARVVRNVNSEIVLLHWQIGSRIRSEVLGDARAEYGQRVNKLPRGRASGKFISIAR